MIVACVRTGTRYPIEYVEKLRNMVRRHTSRPDVEIVCLTDQPERCEGVTFLDCSHLDLPRWWLKMALFSWTWRAGRRVVYFDLDTVIVASIDPLLGLELPFAISANFTRLHGHKTWPCKFGSCVMVFGEGFGNWVWKSFQRNASQFMREDAQYGDQMVIERIFPAASLLQDFLPADFLVSYRAIGEQPLSSKTAVINFGGKSKPDNTRFEWVRQAWA